MTRVWPALWPPWNRTTTSACSDSQSTILPLPSSPHCEPITATFAIQVPSQAASRCNANPVKGLGPKHLDSIRIKDDTPPDKATHRFGGIPQDRLGRYFKVLRRLHGDRSGPGSMERTMGHDGAAGLTRACHGPIAHDTLTRQAQGRNDKTGRHKGGRHEIRHAIRQEIFH